MIKSLLDFVFPPLCLHCKERTDWPYFCPPCWDLCSPLDPVGRCPDCFCELDEKGCCLRCNRYGSLGFVFAAVFARASPAKLLFRERNEAAAALAGFFVHEWIQLKWPQPDLICPLMGMQSIALSLAEMLSIDCAHSEEQIEEDQVLLLLSGGEPFSLLDEEVSRYIEAFPKKIFVLSLLSNDSTHLWPHSLSRECL